MPSPHTHSLLQLPAHSIPSTSTNTSPVHFSPSIRPSHNTPSRHPAPSTGLSASVSSTDLFIFHSICLNFPKKVIRQWTFPALFTLTASRF
ncbi:hypothetical protein E2C01_055780 [Portunus trituberculatus]|uniref:Uncharacterized protein n=1 Tax=Portunus trituberculatus TaxID=210409 RepID=A0A5B7GVN4_PORTR|nr:hypothetical protein [Portunus trituberculatus]